jgi:hypothetical protein
MISLLRARASTLGPGEASRGRLRVEAMALQFSSALKVPKQPVQGSRKRESAKASKGSRLKIRKRALGKV